MEYVNLGKTGLKVSRLCLGMMTYGSKAWREWILPEEQSRPFIKDAVDAGINFFDTADVYSHGESERILGNAIRDLSLRRDQIVIATKVFNPLEKGPNLGGLSRKHIFHAIDESLQRMRMDYVDLYQIHRFDYSTPIEETMEALHDVVKSGKVRYLGASSMFAWQFAKMLYTSDKHGWSRFVTMQNHYNIIYREEEREMMPMCREEGIGVIPWSPLARGFVAGNRRKEDRGETSRAKTDDYAQGLYFQDSDFAMVDRISAIAKKRGVTNIQVALAWLLQQPGVTAPIIGVSKPGQFADLLKGLEVTLDADDLKQLAEAYQPHPIGGHS